MPQLCNNWKMYYVQKNLQEKKNNSIFAHNLYIKELRVDLIGDINIALSSVPACWCCAFVCVSDRVNNHAEKPYVHRVGCPTFEDDHMRSRIWGGCWGTNWTVRLFQKKEEENGSSTRWECKFAFICVATNNINEGFFSGLWACGTSDRPALIFCSINDVHISRTSRV